MQSEVIDSKFYKIKKGAKKIGENCSKSSGNKNRKKFVNFTKYLTHMRSI